MSIVQCDVPVPLVGSNQNDRIAAVWSELLKDPSSVDLFARYEDITEGVKYIVVSRGNLAFVVAEVDGELWLMRVIDFSTTETTASMLSRH